MDVAGMKTYQDFMEKCQRHRKKEYLYHDEFQNQHDAFHQRIKELCRNKEEFHHYHRHIKYTRPVIVLFNLTIWYLLIRYAGVKAFSIFFAIILSMGGLYEFFFLRRIENRILKPIGKLKNGVEEIAKGNYHVHIESDIRNEIGLLIDSFNDMAQKLQESEKIKAEYEENRKTLIANISHDLKTPITSIQGYIEAITDENAVSPENINKYLKIIYSNTAYMNKLIDDLFLFSKLDMQKLALQFEKVQVRPFFNDLMEEFKFELEEKKIEFLYQDKMEHDDTVKIDRKRLHQVFRNIIGNAVKYGPEEKLSVRIVLYRQDDAVCIDIADNGPGIPQDKLPYIFERFYRIDTERTKDFISTGLGLAIAKELIEAHGGRIAVSSSESKGTCFTIMLPALQ